MSSNSVPDTVREVFITFRPRSHMAPGLPWFPTPITTDYVPAETSRSINDFNNDR
jgi:hypothetical protein